MTIESEEATTRYRGNDSKVRGEQHVDPAFLHLVPEDEDIMSSGPCFDIKLRERLQDSGIWVTTLERESVQSLSAPGRTDGKGLKFATDWHTEDPYLEAVRSPSMEVAIDPAVGLIDGSEYKGFIELMLIVDRYSRQIARRYPGVRAEIAVMPVYAELAARYLLETGRYLFPYMGDRRFTATTTSTGRKKFALAVAGSHSPEEGFALDTWLGIPDMRVGVMPVIVPA